jgi:hypothetical protein
MIKPKISRPFLVSTFVSGLAVLLLVTTLVPFAAKAGPPPSGDLQTFSIFLPLIRKTYPRSESVFGVETNNLYASSQIAKLQVSGVRNTAFDWSKIEPILTNPPTYDWSQVNENGLKAAAGQGLNLVAIIKSTPLWAQKVTGSYCSPPKPEYMGAYAQFIQAVVTRYSAPPYRIRYWELGNEIDIDPDNVAAGSPFGCWGNSKDKYYGGGYYAEMLKQVYPLVKAADPESQVVVGGLLLDCDPTAPGQATNCRPARFLEGILANQGAPYFDILGFHTYAFYNGQIYENTPSWSTRGGVFMGKISFLREVMANYGVNKPLLMSEISMVCPETQAGCVPLNSDFQEKQANYISWVYTRAFAENLKGAIWYTFEDSGWRSSGLYQGSIPKPAYYAYAFTSQKLGEAAWIGAVSQYPGITGYEFQIPGRRLWVLWSSTQTNQMVTLPGNVSAIYDKYGNSIPVTSSLNINSPVYIELAP